jgi:hypothetical protein
MIATFLWAACNTKGTHPVYAYCLEPEHKEIINSYAGNTYRETSEGKPMYFTTRFLGETIDIQEEDCPLSYDKSTWLKPHIIAAD